MNSSTASAVNSFSRRGFAAAATAVSASRVLGANDRIRVGMVGTGGRGSYDLEEIVKLEGTNVTVAGICDVYRPNREKAVARAEKVFGTKPRATTDYQEMLGWSDIDAVVIATPDFGHPYILKAAVEAGKDAYCEKPMAVELDPARAAYLAAKRGDRIVQIGTQRRSDGKHMAAAKLAQSGAIGKITRIEIAYNVQQPRWRRDASKINPADVDWKRYRMHLPEKAFDARGFLEWQLFGDYTNGISGLWMCHFVDLVHWFLEDPYASSAASNGGLYLWKDGREHTDVFQTLLEYEKGFHFSFGMSLTNSNGNRNLWMGTLGTIDLDAMTISGAGSEMKEKVPGERAITAEPATSHMQNFIDCVRSRKAPRCDIQAGFSHAVACAMAAESLNTGHRVRFNRDTLAFA